MTEIVTFPPNIPQELSLKFPDGKAITTNRGPRVLYTLTDDRVMFLDPPVADRLRALKLSPGEKFKLMRVKPDGDGSPITWKLARVNGKPKSLVRDPKSEWLRCAEEAIDMLVEVREKAAAKELPVQFTGEDLRQVAATLYIGRGQDRRYSVGGSR